MRAHRTIPLAVLLAILPACTQGEGPVLDEAREVTAFTRIEAGSGIHVSVSIGQEESVIVHAQANIAESVRTEVRNGTLVVEATDDFTTDEPVVVNVAAPTLEAIALNGGAELTADLKADTFAIELSGGSRATVTGAVDHLTLHARGGAVASLANLACGDVAVTLDGGTAADVLATGAVTGSASGGATLTISGEASIDVETSGGASVTRNGAAS